MQQQTFERILIRGKFIQNYKALYPRSAAIFNYMITEYKIACNAAEAYIIEHPDIDAIETSAAQAFNDIRNYKLYGVELKVTIREWYRIFAQTWYDRKQMPIFIPSAQHRIIMPVRYNVGLQEDYITIRFAGIQLVGKWEGVDSATWKSNIVLLSNIAHLDQITDEHEITHLELGIVVYKILADNIQDFCMWIDQDDVHREERKQLSWVRRN